MAVWSDRQELFLNTPTIASITELITILQNVYDPDRLVLDAALRLRPYIHTHAHQNQICFFFMVLVVGQQSSMGRALGPFHLGLLH